MPSLDQWIQIAQTLGVAVACLVALGAAAWASLRWIANNVVVKLMERVLKYFDDRDVREQQVVTAVQSVLTGLAEIKTLVIHTNKATVLPPKNGN